MNAIQVAFALVEKFLTGTVEEKAPVKLPVLIVEDRESDADMLQYCVRKCGFESEWVQTIAEASANIKLKRYSLLILDVAFPNEDGLEFGNRVHFRHPDLPVLIVTGTDVYFKRPDGDTIYRMPPGKLFSLCVKGTSGMALLDAIAEKLRSNGNGNGKVNRKRLYWLILLVIVLTYIVGDLHLLEALSAKLKSLTP